MRTVWDSHIVNFGFPDGFDFHFCHSGCGLNASGGLGFHLTPSATSGAPSLAKVTLADRMFSSPMFTLFAGCKTRCCSADQFGCQAVYRAVQLL